MAPIPPSEMMMWIDIILPIIPVLLMVLVGMYISDREADRKKIKETGDTKAYVLSWTDLGLYSILASVLALVSVGSLLNDFLTNFWLTMSIAGGMGLIFRSILPELQEIIATKTKAVIQAIFK